MRIIRNENINAILFLDIETVPQWQTLAEAPDYVQKEWIYKFKFREGAPKKPDPTNINSEQDFIQKKYFNYFADLWQEQAGLFPEFSKIICISAGYVVGGTLRLTSFYDNSEEALLRRFADILNHFRASSPSFKLCAHYGKGSISFLQLKEC